MSDSNSSMETLRMRQSCFLGEADGDSGGVSARKTLRAGAEGAEGALAAVGFAVVVEWLGWIASANLASHKISKIYAEFLPTQFRVKF